MKKWFCKYLKNLWGYFNEHKPNRQLSADTFCLGDRVIIKRRLGTLEEGSVGIILDIDSQGNLTIKMTRSSDAYEYVIMVNDIDVLEKR